MLSGSIPNFKIKQTNKQKNSTQEAASVTKPTLTFKKPLLRRPLHMPSFHDLHPLEKVLWFCNGSSPIPVRGGSACPCFGPCLAHEAPHGNRRPGQRLPPPSVVLSHCQDSQPWAGRAVRRITIWGLLPRPSKLLPWRAQSSNTDIRELAH